LSDIVYLIKHGLPCGTPQFLVAEHPAECPQKGILTGSKLWGAARQAVLDQIDNIRQLKLF
jgi:hypothetical protein